MIYNVLQKIKTLKELLEQIETITSNEHLVVDVGNNKENIEYVTYEKDEVNIFKNLDSEEYEIFRMDFTEVDLNPQRIKIEVDSNPVSIDINLKDITHDSTKEKDDVELVLTY